MTAAIVFDLDGTLVDSAPDIAAAANRLLEEMTLAPLPVPLLTSFIGHGIPDLVHRVMAARGLPRERHKALNARMIALYSERPAELSRPYPGVPEMLARLAGKGHRLGVCTNKYRGLSLAILEALDLARHFDVVIGGDSLAVKKPDPAPLHAAFERLGATGLYVGDSEVDAETAAAAGCDFALFTEGYRKAGIETLPHAFAFDDHGALPDLLARRARSGAG